MIAGVGVDITTVQRVERTLRRWPRFAMRCFTDGERAYCNARRHAAAHYAARFAAKEAAAKALGGRFAWQEVEVVAGTPQPALRVAGRARAALGAARTHLSLSHDGDHAIAVVVVEGAPA